MSKRTIKKLQQLGLSLNEAKVYSALLFIGQTSAGKIIKKTQLHRSVVYTSLDKLANKKLIFKLKRKKIMHFQATDPSRLIQNAENKKEIAQKLVPQLKGLIDKTLPQINIYEGIVSYRRYWIDGAKKWPVGSVDYVAGSIMKKWQRFMGPDLKKMFKIRKRRKIKWKMIVFYKETLEMELLRKFPHLHDYRFIKRDVKLTGNFNVVNNDILILHSVKEPMVIEIKSKSLVKVFKNIFDLLWESGEKINPNSS